MVKFFYDLKADTTREAELLGKKAVALDPNDSQCHANLAFAYLFQRKFELAGAATQRALEINSNDPLAVSSRAQWLSRAGFAEEALRKLDEMVRRDPHPPSWYWGNRATALLSLERYEEATAAIDWKDRTFWWDHYMRGICYIYLGKPSQAQAEIVAMQLERPSVTISEVMKAEPFKNAVDEQRIIGGLRKAGLPE
jgi:tetratricopeptide (TPR) repeat protein